MLFSGYCPKVKKIVMYQVGSMSWFCIKTGMADSACDKLWKAVLSVSVVTAHTHKKNDKAVSMHNTDAK